MKINFFIFFIALFSFLNAHSHDHHGHDHHGHGALEGKLKVALSIQPLMFFINEIAKDKVEASVLVPPSKNPETFEPDVNSIQTLLNADLFIGIGMDFEKIWLPKVQKSNDMHTTLLLLDEVLGFKDAEHLWISIKNMNLIAKYIGDELSRFDPKNEEFYEKNLESLLKKIDSTKIILKQNFDMMKNKEFITQHPMFNNLSEEYGLVEHSLEMHGKKYGLQDMLKLVSLGKKLGIKKIISISNSKDIKTIARDIGAKVVLIDIYSENILNMMINFSKELSDSY